MPTTYDDVASVAHDTEHFSSRDVGVVSASDGSFLIAHPITSEPPFHTEARRLLLPAFAPKVIERLRPTTVDIADELLDAILQHGHGDAAVDYAQHIPVRVTALMLGIPTQNEDQFTDWADRILQVAPTTKESLDRRPRRSSNTFAVRLSSAPSSEAMTW